MILAQKQTHRSMEENSPEMNPHLNGQFIYNIEGKNIQWGNTASSINSVEKNWTAICKRIRLNYTLTPCIKINSKWNKDKHKI